MVLIYLTTGRFYLLTTFIQFSLPFLPSPASSNHKWFLFLRVLTTSFFMWLYISQKSFFDGSSLLPLTSTPSPSPAFWNHGIRTVFSYVTVSVRTSRSPLSPLIGTQCTSLVHFLLTFFLNFPHPGHHLYWSALCRLPVTENVTKVAYAKYLLIFFVTWKTQR